jgi:hypothetical protein
VVAVLGLASDPGTALGGLTLGALVGGGMAIREHDRPGAGTSGMVRVATRTGAACLGLWLVATGLLVLLGTSTGSVLMTLLLMAVPTTARLWRRRAAATVVPGPGPSAVQLRTVVPSPVLSMLSTPELCLAWRRSYLTLMDLPAGPEQGELVRVRQRMLDELERRDAAGFHRWLDAWARVGGDPSRYLAAGPGG